MISARCSFDLGRLRGSCGIPPAEEAQDIGGRELIAEMRSQDAGPKPAQILVEVAPDWNEIAHVDVRRAAPRMQAPGGHPSGGIAVACDIEPREHRGEVEGREMIGRQRGDHRHAGQHGFERQHGLDAFAGEQHPRFPPAFPPLSVGAESAPWTLPMRFGGCCAGRGHCSPLPSGERSDRDFSAASAS
jgi:hypothetical protein